MTAPANGASRYIDVKPYGDGYLVVADEAAYRQRAGESGNDQGWDDLNYYGRKEEDQWSVEFPIGAKLLLAGGRIFAVEFGAAKVILREIHPPVSHKP